MYMHIYVYIYIYIYVYIHLCMEILSSEIGRTASDVNNCYYTFLFIYYLHVISLISNL